MLVRCCLVHSDLRVKHFFETSEAPSHPLDCGPLKHPLIATAPLLTRSSTTQFTVNPGCVENSSGSDLSFSSKDLHRGAMNLRGKLRLLVDIKALLALLL